MRRRILNGYLIDSWTWIEYWRKNPSTLPYIEGDEPIFTSIISLTEICRYFIREFDITMMDSRLADVKVRSKILNLEEDIAILAGSYIKQEVPGIADALILATARHKELKIVTGDHHFKLLADVIFLEKNP
jgi:predicted nucleic acid-binding protein